MKTSYFKIAMKIGAGLVVGKYFGGMITTLMRMAEYETAVMIAKLSPEAEKFAADKVDALIKFSKTGKVTIE